MLQNCASECVKNRTYRTLQETCDEGASCSSGQGSEALIGSLHFKALPTNRQKTRTCCCSCSCYKILCCNMPFDKNFLRKRACVRPRFKEHCAGRQLHAPTAQLCSVPSTTIQSAMGNDVMRTAFLPKKSERESWQSSSEAPFRTTRAAYAWSLIKIQTEDKLGVSGFQRHGSSSSLGTVGGHRGQNLLARGWLAIGWHSFKAARSRAASPPPRQEKCVIGRRSLNIFV